MSRKTLFTGNGVTVICFLTEFDDLNSYVFIVFYIQRPQSWLLLKTILLNLGIKSSPIFILTEINRKFTHCFKQIRNQKMFPYVAGISSCSTFTFSWKSVHRNQCEGLINSTKKGECSIRTSKNKGEEIIWTVCFLSWSYNIHGSR